MIMPYFGRWPEWMDLFLYSCSKNPFIDFLFFTDIPVPQKTYSNTIFYYITFADYCKRISKKLGVSFSPSKAYKLCDVRPFYGIVHEEELFGYDWWGWGDIDLVYGDLTMLVNKKNLEKYDMLTTHVNRVSGHFTLIRRESKYTRLCLQINSYRELLEKEENIGMDESYFTRVTQPIYNRLYNAVYYRIIVRFLKRRQHWLDYYWGKITTCIPSRIFWGEYFTTFKPSSNVVNTYNLETGKVICPSGQLSTIIGGE